MFKLSQHCVSRRKSFRELWPYRERTSTQCSAICAVARIASPSTSMKRAPSSAFVWPVFSVISLGVTQSIKERKILDEVRTRCYKRIKKTWCRWVTESLNASLLPCLYCFPKTFPDNVNHQELHRATQKVLCSHSFVQVSVETILCSEEGKGIYKAERKDS